MKKTLKQDYRKAIDKKFGNPIAQIDKLILQAKELKSKYEKN